MGTTHPVRQGPLQVRVKRENGSAEVRALGEIDLATAPAFETTLRNALEGDGSALVVDLRQVSFIDPSGARALLWATARSGQIGRSLLIRCNQTTQRMIGLMGLADALPLVISGGFTPLYRSTDSDSFAAQGG